MSERLSIDLPSYLSNVEIGWVSKPSYGNASPILGHTHSLGRDLVLPYTTLESRFHFQDALKIAEIDSVFKVCPRTPLSPYFPSLLAYSTGMTSTFIDIGGGPRGYTEYLQYRYVNSMTMGFSQRTHLVSGAWDLKVLDPHRLIRFYGQNNQGDLMSQWKDFLKSAQKQFMYGADFVSATTKFEKDALPDFQAFLELYLLISTIKDGASGILRIDATWSEFMKQIVYFSTQCFEEVHLFQPLVSGSDSDEIFLILKHSRTSRKDYFIALNSLFDNVPKEDIFGFLKSDIPNKFEKDFDNAKSLFLEIKNKTLLQIQKYMSNDTEDNLPRDMEKNIDLKLKLAEWSLPDV